jgi:hypothetical protein
MNNERVLQIASVFLRLALGITFLFSIGDRFGWLGAYGSKNVSWAIGPTSCNTSPCLTRLFRKA